MSNKNRASKRNGGESVETITTADVATVDASELVGSDSVVGEAVPPVMPGEASAQPSAKVAEGPITLTRKNTHRNGYHVYGADGIRGSVFVSKSLIVGVPPETLSVSATATGEGDTLSGIVYIDPEVAAKKREQREAREKRKETLATRRAEQKTKKEARIAKLQAQVDKLKAKEAAEAAKKAGKTAEGAGTEAPAEGNATGGEPVTGVEQPFTDAPVSE